MKPQSTSATHRRSGFTILELLIVITIIGILSALLFYAFGGALRTVAVTEVKAEFTQLESSMKKFESDYGVIPPSSIVLTEDPGATAWDVISKSVLRKMFGSNVDFTQVVDFNNDGDTTDVITLTSSECLLFFLGGMPDGTTGTTLTGFSANKEKPFARGGDNRVDPQFTGFDSNRFIDEDGDGMPEYRDLATDLSVATIYASSNNGQGYSDSDGSVAHFHQADGATAWNKNSFQLISPGADGDFGFDEEPNPFVVLTWTDSSSATGAQSDNIANFAPGTMGQ